MVKVKRLRCDLVQLPRVTDLIGKNILAGGGSAQVCRVDIQQGNAAYTFKANIVPIVPPPADIQNCDGAAQILRKRFDLLCKDTPTTLSEGAYGAVSHVIDSNHFLTGLSGRYHASGFMRYLNARGGSVHRIIYSGDLGRAGNRVNGMRVFSGISPDCADGGVRTDPVPASLDWFGVTFGATVISHIPAPNMKKTNE